MQKIALDDILGFAAYENARDEFRREIIEKKKLRRVALGENISLVFENRDTVLFQIQEMLRAERITDLDKIREEIAVYNELVPDRGELSATLFIEIEDQSHLRDELLKFRGIEDSLTLLIGGERIPGRFEAGRSKEDKISAVQYVRFLLSGEARQGLMAGAPAEIVIDHPNYRASKVLEAGVQESLARDLAE